jgi:hypothetical protein
MATLNLESRPKLGLHWKEDCDWQETALMLRGFQGLPRCRRPVYLSFYVMHQTLRNDDFTGWTAGCSAFHLDHAVMDRGGS